MLDVLGEVEYVIVIVFVELGNVIVRGVFKLGLIFFILKGIFLLFMVIFWMFNVCVFNINVLLLGFLCFILSVMLLISCLVLKFVVRFRLRWVIWILLGFVKEW